MFIFLPVFVFLPFIPLAALAGHHFDDVPSSRRHRRHAQQDSVCNLTRRGAAQAKAGPMKLVDKHAGKNFFDEWDFFTAADPNKGNVRYVSKKEATASGLASVGADNVVVIAVDDTSTIPVGGKRKSVRITSRKSYDGGLFVLDADAMPSGCATWPAFWTVGSDWPKNGEIDIIEGVNNQKHNQITLHTASDAPGCKLDASARPAKHTTKAYSGQVMSTTCTSLPSSNTGCGFFDADPNSFGAGVKKSGGAVYAMLWDSVGIRIWHFNRSNTPPDLTAFRPDPSTWPIPSGFWSSTSCPVDQFLKDHHIVINTNLCGDWAASAYPRSGCPGTCAEHVADPKNFKDAKWKINYVATYR